MCEIAVFNPEKHNITTVQDAAGTFYREQGDGLGVVLVKDRGDHFEYVTYKSTDPHWQTLYSTVRRHWEDTYRVVVHGRNATSGNINRDTAHPIEVDCDCTDFEYVVHNGSVRNHSDKRERLRDEDHTINTEVDSELIAHEVGDLPDDVDSLTYNTYPIRGNLNYLLFAPHGIFVRMGHRYYVTEDFTLTCRPAYFDNIDGNKKVKWMVVKPGAEIDHAKSFTSGTTGNSTSVVGATGGTDRTNYRRYTDGQSNNAETTSESGAGDEDTYTITYRDLVPRIDRITAIQPAPGVVRVIDRETSKVTFIYEDEDPDAYYWYVPEDRPDEEQQEMEDYVDNNLLDGVPDYVRETSRRAWQEAIAAEENLTMEEAANIAEEVEEFLNA